jgi:hypothetical protein
MIMFGGYDDALLGDLWQLSFSGTPTWSPLVASGTGPSPRGGYAAIYDPEGQRMIVFGGYDGVSPPANRIGDTWALSLSGSPTWTPIVTSGPAPSARSSLSGVYDAEHHAMVIFGGTDPNFRNDAWRLSLDGTPAWSLLAAGETAPGEREEHSAVFDSKRDRMVIFAGYDSSIRNYGDLWSLDLGDAPAWTSPVPDGVPPSARWGMKAIYDPGRDGMLLYGGWDFTYCRDLWLLQWSDPPSSGTIATQSALADAEAAHLVWSVPGSIIQPGTVERSADGSTWSVVGAVIPDATGHMSFDDAGVPPRQPRAWRVRVSVAGTSLTSDPEWLTIGGTTAVEPAGVAFALSLAGRASTPGAIAVSCALPRTGNARVELLDVSGRRIDSRDLLAAGKGVHRVELGRGLPGGMFFVRLLSGNDVASIKAVNLP